MQQFFDANERPPQGGFHYFYDPETKLRLISGGSAQQVFDEVKRFRVNNGIFSSNHDLWEELWSYWCAREPHRCTNSVNTPAHQIGWRDVANFALIVKATITRRGFEPQEEAERRAAICARCPMNQPLSDCKLCRDAVNAIMEDLAGKHTSRDSELRACGVCGCELKSAVHIDLAAQQQAITPEQNRMFPDFCWKKKR